MDLCKDIALNEENVERLLTSIDRRNSDVRLSIATRFADNSRKWETFKANGVPVFEIAWFGKERMLTDLRR